ncbi:MAG: hypothetical protein WBK51_12450 [Polaromonas sp.]
MPAFYYSGLCYPNAIDALAAHKSVFPKIDASFMVTIAHTPAATITNNGLMVSTLSRFDLSRNAGNNNPSTHQTTLQLTQCTTPTANFDPLVSGLFFSFGFAGVMLMYFGSHTIGLVIKAVRDY